MQFKSITLALFGATGLMAHPFTERDSANPGGFVELDRKPASDGNGSLVFFGPGSKGITKRVGTNAVEERGSCQSKQPPVCSAEYTARNEICDKLVTELFADETVGVGEAPRQICYEGEAAETNEYCCVSWHNVVKNLNKGDLAPIAQEIMQTCTSEGISGKENNIYVHDTCTSVCLSNRGVGC
ncbi:hypothetical protein F4819DRAFT_505265 [Hypoxylon fuscum]|nr:hypothetical protein F4819DRAFT_505265 [Hypoxylon fuscum]